MIKRLIALLLVAGLVILLIINVIEDKKVREAEQAKQQEYAVQPADNPAQVVPSGGALKEGQQAPDVQTTTLDGEVVSLSDYEGKKVFLNFWATWCPPCIEEMPHMQKYYENEAEEQNVEILAVNLTNMDNGINRVKSFVSDYKLTFPILLDETGLLGEEFQAITVPTTYLLNEEGVIIKKITGPMDQEMMAELIEEAE